MNWLLGALILLERVGVGTGQSDADELPFT